MMSMEPFEPDPSMTLRDARLMHRISASYEFANDPSFILRRGLVEEIYEYRSELASPENRYELEGELGDVLWYVTELASWWSIDMNGLSDNLPLDRYQKQGSKGLLTPIFDTDLTQVDPDEHPLSALAITALRVVDTINPKTDGLWIGIDKRPNLNSALKDLLMVTSQLATENDLTLSVAIRHNKHKLDNRGRKVHVIEEDGQDIDVTTGRQALADADPLVGRLLYGVIKDQQIIERWKE